jgi:hypothetical protein
MEFEDEARSFTAAIQKLQDYKAKNAIQIRRPKTKATVSPKGADC